MNGHEIPQMKGIKKWNQINGLVLVYANILLLLVFVPFFAGQEKGQEGGVPHLNPTGFMFKRPLI